MCKYVTTCMQLSQHDRECNYFNICSLPYNCNKTTQRNTTVLFSVTVVNAVHLRDEYFVTTVNTTQLFSHTATDLLDKGDVVTFQQYSSCRTQRTCHLPTLKRSLEKLYCNRFQRWLLNSCLLPPMLTVNCQWPSRLTATFRICCKINFSNLGQTKNYDNGFQYGHHKYTVTGR